ncbi:putative TLR4 interactor with leucine rich repeats [Hypsibius exemplaris]|uniref:TLR4 interactor with leucine rich repeats n=1 Tax=Hypsibius exemplaris TaxID=2072580 RepID=A0A1W0WRE7_HYPEX|nr:putative TLR4 interactor with leucine rich repeats [Hypsibius exemplaris]
MRTTTSRPDLSFLLPAVFLSLVCLTGVTRALCPRMCICDIDERGRSRTRCENGDVNIPANLDLNSLDQDTKVLIVSSKDPSRRNQFQLNGNMFANKRFEEIHLSNSQLDFIGDRTFILVSNTLQVLNLTGNSLLMLNENNFRNLSKLTHLHLDHNRIHDVPQRMGLQLGKLEVLDMSSNPLGVPVIGDVKQTIPESFFQDFTNLQVLGLANTSLDSLPWPAIQKFIPNLRELDMSGNRIESIQPNQLSLIRNLNVMYPYRQQPHPSDRAWCPELEGLNISGNPGLVLQSKMFMALPNLKTLTMSQMSKSTLPQDLFAYDNYIGYLDMSNNRLLQLDDEFFRPLVNLQTLILANNELNRVPATVGLPGLRALDLSANRLTNFPDSLVNTFYTPSSFMKSLKLNGNLWNCDCGVASLGRWLASQSGNPGYPVVCIGNGNFTCPVCYEPAGMRGTPLNSLSPQLLETCVDTGPRPVASSANVDVIIAVVVCVIVLIIAILLLVLWYRNRLHSYRTYEEKRKDGDAFEHNGDIGDVFEEVPPISKPKNGLPSSIIHVAPPVSALPKQESNV